VNVKKSPDQYFIILGQTNLQAGWLGFDSWQG